MVEPLNTKAPEFKPDAEMFVCMDKTGCYHVSWNKDQHKEKMLLVNAKDEARYIRTSPSLPAVDGGRLLDLISQYWDLAYAEGLAGASHDTKAGDAQRCLSAILAMVSAAESRVQLLEAENERLREALKPFGEYLTDMPFDLDNHGNPLPDDTQPGWTYLKAGDFRRARNALKENGQ